MTEPTAGPIPGPIPGPTPAPRVLAPVSADDPTGRAWVVALNAAHQHLTGPLDEAALDRLYAWSAQVWLVQTPEAEPAGFVVTVPAGSAYDSPNYRAHLALRDHLTYLDRIVIAPAFRRRGLASAAYDEIEVTARPTGRLALEVNVEPPNEPSLAFHRHRGYQPVGELDAGVGKRVVLMVKELG